VLVERSDWRDGPTRHLAWVNDGAVQVVNRNAPGEDWGEALPNPFNDFRRDDYDGRRSQQATQEQNQATQEPRCQSRTAVIIVEQVSHS
jgi:hypothetical protein